MLNNYSQSQAWILCVIAIVTALIRKFRGKVHRILRIKSGSHGAGKPQRHVILQSLMPRRDSAVPRRSRWLRPRFQPPLRGAERDNAHATGALDFSLPFPEGRVFWQMLNTTHPFGPQ